MNPSSLQPCEDCHDHSALGVPAALRTIAAAIAARDDVLLVLPGLVYRRDVIDRLHVGAPHQVDLWRIVRGRPMAPADLHDLIATLVGAILPGAVWRAEPAEHSYTEQGRQVDVCTGKRLDEAAKDLDQLAPSRVAAPSRSQ